MESQLTGVESSMMNETEPHLESDIFDRLIVRYGEIWLKGQNKGDFEKRLKKNIMKQLESDNHFKKKIKVKRQRSYLELIGISQPQKIENIFGVYTISKALVCALDINSIVSAVKGFRLKSNQTFRVTAKRENKKFEYSSSELCVMIGDAIRKNTKAKVDLERFDVEIGIHVRDKDVLLWQDKTSGPGGLPLGTQQRVLSIAESERDVIAAVLMMRRGCCLDIYNKSGNQKKDIEAAVARFHVGVEAKKLRSAKDLAAYIQMRPNLVIVASSKESKLSCEDIIDRCAQIDKRCVVSGGVKCLGGNKAVNVERVLVLDPLEGLSKKQVDKLKERWIA